MRTLSLVAFGALGISLFSGCPKAVEPFVPDFDVPSLDASPPPVGQGIGQACATTGECRPGLACGDTGDCTPAGTQTVGQECTITAECESGAYCGPQWGCVGSKTYKPEANCEVDADCATDFDPDAKCVPLLPNLCQLEGEGGPGGNCSLDRDCEAGLYCQFLGFTGLCAPAGETDWGQPCEQTVECQAGLICPESGECKTLVEALADVKWDGTECPALDPSDPRVFFEVPESDGVLSNFYRLPFPNDIRLGAGKTMAGHPAPGRGVLAFDPVQRILDAINEGMDGFGTSPTVFFRFSAPLDFDSVDFSHDETEPNLNLVNIDQDSAGYKQPKGYVWAASDGRGKYFCDNWLLLRNRPQDPLDSATTYAAIITKGMRSCLTPESDEFVCDPTSDDFRADDDMQALLAASKPGDARLATAWDKYAKLRQYLSDEGIPTSDVVAAAVFTTVDASKVMRNARPVVRALAPPKIKEVVVCDEGVTSPCEDADDEVRTCSAANGAFHEIHGKIEIPIFQEGTAPYLEPSQGGNIKISDAGIPRVVRTEDVCFSLSIPKSDPPPTGWPVVIYSHGTGGSYRSAMLDGTAQSMAISKSNSNGSGAAVLNIDGSMHGPRRGLDLPPEVLFFNIGNPQAARGNTYQGAIDNYALVHWIENADTDIAGVAGAKLDGARIGFLGHSQGATIGPLFAAFEDSLGAVLLSGAGGGLVESLLNKTEPVNVPAGVQLAVREDSLPGATHPVLSLMQQYFDPVDNANYGALLTQTPPDTVSPPHNSLVIYGQNDTFTPAGTTRILADVMRLNIIAPAIQTGPGEPFEGYLGEDPETDKVIEPPVGADFNIGEDAVTQGLLQYQPDGDYNGHFVLFRHPAAQKQAREFFASWFATGVATIPVP